MRKLSRAVLLGAALLALAGPQAQAAEPYPADYETVVAQARKELAGDHKPKLKAKLKDLSSYDLVFVGSPNWWGTVAPYGHTAVGNSLAGQPDKGVPPPGRDKLLWARGGIPCRDNCAGFKKVAEAMMAQGLV